jgi:hypothetical protein
MNSHSCKKKEVLSKPLKTSIHLWMSSLSIYSERFLFKSWSAIGIGAQ